MNEPGEAVELEDGFQVRAHLDTTSQGRVRGVLQGPGETRVPDEPHGQEAANIEGEVQERGQIAKELGWQVVSLIDDPDGQI